MESESLIFTGLEIQREYLYETGVHIEKNKLFYPQIGVGKRLDGGRRRVKKYLWSF